MLAREGGDCREVECGQWALIWHIACSITHMMGDGYSLTLQSDTERQSSKYKSASQCFKLGRERIVIRLFNQEFFICVGVWGNQTNVSFFVRSKFGTKPLNRKMLNTKSLSRLLQNNCCFFRQPCGQCRFGNSTLMVIAGHS